MLLDCCSTLTERFRKNFYQLDQDVSLAFSSTIQDTSAEVLNQDPVFDFRRNLIEKKKR